MRIAFLVGEFPVISETFILSQITGLIDRGHRVDIYARRPDQTEVIHGDVLSYRLLDCTTYYNDVPANPVRRYLGALGILAKHLFTNPRAILRCFRWRRRMQPRFSLHVLFGIKPFLPERRYDVVHCHFGQLGLRGLFLKDIGVLHGKLVTTYYGQDVTQYPRQNGSDVYRRLFDTGDLFLVLSERMKRQLIELGCDSRRVRVHHLGVDCNRFAFRPREFRGSDTLRVVTVARLTEKKGVAYGIRAIAELARAGVNVQYSIIGDGPLRGDLESVIEENEMTAMVHLMGWKNQDEVARLLDESDVFLAPSVASRGGDEEGTPTVLMEAMARGLPVVSTTHSAIPEVVEDGVTGFLAPEQDVEGLVDKLMYIVRNPDQVQALKSAARSTIEAEFNAENQNEELVRAYAGLLNAGEG